MPKPDTFLEDLKTEIKEFRTRCPALKNEDLFLVWFLRAYVTEDIDSAAKSITNGSKDKGVDAVFIDDTARCVFILQAKYHHKQVGANESAPDVRGFAQLSHTITAEDRSVFQEFVKNADPLVAKKLTDARECITRRNYRLWLHYSTLGRCSSFLREDAEAIVAKAPRSTRIEVVDCNRLGIIMRDYLDGVAPPIPTLDLVMESGKGIKVNGILQRYDQRSQIESWVFSMQGDQVSDLFSVGGKRLFARNIRGYLGESGGVNKSMEGTLRREPEKFFYFNNGITILCDKAERVGEKGKDILRVSNPQIINGQQTTRTLSRLATEAIKASVIVRVIQVPRGGDDGDEDFDSFVSQVVEGTNWQNAIKPSDLISNDRKQVELQREFRKRGYLYLRKRESKSEARAAVGSKQYIPIKKEDIARAVAGCDLDPVEARSGVENLFDEDKYEVIFPNSDPRYYLTRYWTMRKVSACSWGHPERGYAKWLVQNFVWEKLSPLLKSEAAQERFVKQLEEGKTDVQHPLEDAIEKVFRASTSYRLRYRHKDKSANDPSTFYKSRRGHHKKFKTFWDGKHNKNRKGFKKAWKKLVAAMKAR
jgi:hypothetical protein